MFESWDQVRDISAEWLLIYNEVRPHDAFWLTTSHVSGPAERWKFSIASVSLTGELTSGERKSKERWLKILSDFKHRQLTFPQLAVTDGQLSIWTALGELHSTEEV